MNQPTQINEYWKQRGRTYDKEVRLAGQYHRVQESVLVEVLKLGGLPTQSILEIGCGFGRITRVLSQAFPAAHITALDLSDDQLANARRYCEGCPNITFARYDLYAGEPLPGGPFDLAVACEVFLHHPCRPVRSFVDRLLASASYIVNIDWCEDWQTPVSNHVWIHNYRVLYRDAGLSSAGFALPEKVDGKQQRLFVAGRSLPDQVRELERLVAHYTPNCPEPAWPSATQTPRAPLPESWDIAVRTGVSELLQVIPEGATVILVEDGQWPVTGLLQSRKVLPFIERDGRWWGPPENDEVALRELNRMRSAGASYFAYAWPSFWWMEHYARFSQQLRQNFPILLQNDRLVVFQLNPPTEDGCRV